MKALTHRQETALVLVARGSVSSYAAKSCPSLVKRGLVRDCGPRRLVRWEATSAGSQLAAEITAERLALLREGRL